MSKTNQQEQEQAKPPSKAESDEKPAGEIRLRRDQDERAPLDT
jgi:hypothetical protein